MIKQFNEIPAFKNNNLILSHPGDACRDIRAGEDGMIPPRCSSEFIYTGLHLCLPPWLCGIMQARSGQLKQDVTAEGVIDSGYRGAIGIKLFNHHLHEPYRYRTGDRIVQIKFDLVPEGFFRHLCKFGESGFGEFKIEESDSMDDWLVTSRGDNGFGSSGLK